MNPVASEASSVIKCGVLDGLKVQSITGTVPTQNRPKMLMLSFATCSFRLHISGKRKEHKDKRLPSGGGGGLPYEG